MQMLAIDLGKRSFHVHGIDNDGTVYRPGDVTYGQQRVEGESIYQTVTIQDAAGRFHALEYEMIPDGAGRMTGFTLKPRTINSHTTTTVRPKRTGMIILTAT